MNKIEHKSTTAHAMANAHPAAKTSRARRRLFGWTVTLATLGILYLAAHGTPSPARWGQATDKAQALRVELVRVGNGAPPNYEVFRLREGIERFLITDINNPGSSMRAQSELGHARGLQTASTYRAQPFTASAPQAESWRYTPPWAFNTEAYDTIEENRFLAVSHHPLSTFSIDVDTASYTNVRRMLQAGHLPPREAVRIEEMINYFDYSYPLPDETQPFSVNVDVGPAPWTPAHRLVRIGLKGYEFPPEDRPPVNLVFLIDVSGSMRAANKLPLVRSALIYLVERLQPYDSVGIVVYAGAAGEVLPPTRCDRRGVIREAIGRLEAGGSTNGGQGIRLAYAMAGRHYAPEAVNRVVLATDGDFNVGLTNRGDLVRIVQKHARHGIDLTVLGFGMGNLKDSRLEELADKGNGNYAYIDTQREANRVFGKKLAGTLVTIAKDVKIQVEFNPARVQAYRLIGYENRLLKDEDFNDDTKDAGEIGSGHTVTALYEIVPAGVAYDAPDVDSLRYQRPRAGVGGAADSPAELLHVKLRYKLPKGERSRRIDHTVHDNGIQSLEAMPPDFQFAAAVAAFGMLLRESNHAGDATFEDVVRWARGGMGSERPDIRLEFLDLAEQAGTVARRVETSRRWVEGLVTQN